jgi:hypothetical protein
MTLKIYATEIQDGVAEAVKSSDSLAFYSQACVEELIQDNKDFKKLTDKDNLSIANLDTNDLFYLKSVLVSCGWNLNSDIFTPDELFTARATPEDKPFNFMHNEKDIIGHITGNYLIDDDGNRLGDEMPVSNFHIVTNAVIYKDWSDKEQKERVNKLIAEIKDSDKWFVSMECKFSNFDYALKSSAGIIKIIDRNEASAYLTKHLRVYGGTGQYEDYSIGRVLKNISFIGKGLVNKPANPNSIIIKQEKVFLKASMENDMSYTKEDFDKLNVELSTAKANEQKLDTEVKAKATEVEVVSAKLTELETSIAAKDAEITNLKEAGVTLSSELASLKADFELVTKAKDDAEKKMKEMMEEKKMAKRKACLVDAGVLAEDLEETVANFIELADEAFDKVVAVMKKGMFGKKEENKEEEKKVEKPAAASAEEVLEGAEVVTKAGLNEIPEIEEKDLRSSASEWFETFLKSPKSSK